MWSLGYADLDRPGDCVHRQSNPAMPSDRCIASSPSGGPNAFSTIADNPFAITTFPALSDASLDK